MYRLFEKQPNAETKLKAIAAFLVIAPVGPSWDAANAHYAAAKKAMAAQDVPGCVRECDAAVGVLINRHDTPTSVANDPFRPGNTEVSLA